jgi:spore maturation protein CgeB
MSHTVDTHLLAPQYFLGLQEQGVQVEGTFYTDMLNQKLNSFFLAKWVYRIFPYEIQRKLNQQLLKDVSQFNPHILWIFKGMEIWPSTLRKIKKMGIKLVNYNLDHPFRYVSRGSGNRNVLKSIPVYDLHMTYSRTIKHELEQQFSEIRAAYLPFGYHREVDAMVFSSEELLRICFIGHADQQRAAVISEILKAGQSVDLYGPGWKKYFPKGTAQVRCFEPVIGSNYWQTLRRYRVQLNLFRQHNVGSHNMRTFEIPAVGGIMLADYSEEQSSFFREGQEAFYFHSVPDLIQKARMIIQLSDDEAGKIRQNARTRCLDSNYAYDHRSREVIQLFKSLLHE